MIRLGDIVTYRLTESDVIYVLWRRSLIFDCVEHKTTLVINADLDERLCHTLFRGNEPSIGEEFPLLVTRIWTEHNVNGQVFPDGNDSLWICSAEEGYKVGQWYTPDTKNKLELI